MWILGLRDRSLFLAWGEGAEDFGGGHFILGEQKGGSVVTENPKGGSLKTLEGFRGATAQICLENKDMGGGIAKVIKCYWGVTSVR